MDILELSAIEPSEHGDLLNDLQGNILKGHGRERVLLLLIQFHRGKAAEARKWLHMLGKVGSWVTSARGQMATTAGYRRHKRETLFANLFLTARGYEFIKVNGDWMEQCFRDGMWASQSMLHDRWDPQYDPNEKPMHAMVLLAASDPGILERGAGEIDRSLVDIGIARRQAGRALQAKKADEAGVTRYVEHLNYVDGISQPLFFRDDIAADAGGRTSGERFDPPLSLVLVKDPNGGAQGYGSYLVYRKLEENVRGFKGHERMGNASLADQLRLSGEERKRVGAMVIGRFENGTALAQPQSASNDFDYSSDPKGATCPLFAHIRKVNPRDADSRKHRIVRRGITYDELDPGRKAPPSDESQSLEDMPEEGVGLLFMCFQASIAAQFEYLQGLANDQGGCGMDPLIGQAPVGAGSDAGRTYRWAPAPDSDQPVEAPFPGFVKLKEGEYFFAPPRSFFEWLGRPARET